jgi:phosphoribosylformimino-5-aminoimidazole carboxamide ribotide isomerase
MIIYPTLELQNGRCVSLHRGRLEEPQIWNVDPVKTAEAYSAAGAEWIHVTDFDGISGENRNTKLVETIITHGGTPVQLGGGFRSVHQIADWIDRGAGRIVVSTLAILQPEIVKQAAKQFPDQIVVAVDVFHGKVMSHGWSEETAITPEDFIRTFEHTPLAAMIVSDIDADIHDAENSLALVTRLAGIANAPVIARGMVHTLDDLSRLKYVPDVAGAMVGRRLFDKSLDLEELLALASSETGRTAAFI